jgi:hypothetical protein
MTMKEQVYCLICQRAKNKKNKQKAKNLELIQRLKCFQKLATMQIGTSPRTLDNLLTMIISNQEELTSFTNGMNFASSVGKTEMAEECGLLLMKKEGNGCLFK